MTTMLDHAGWRSRAAGLRPRGQAFIGGDYVDAVAGATFASVNPATGQTLADVAACDAADVDRAVAAARRAFERGDWSRAAPAERKRVLMRLGELVEAHGEELALLDSLDMGKLVRDAAEVDVPAAAGLFSWYGEALDKLYGEIAPTGEGDLALVTREPVGVVGCVIPWNFPLDMAAWKAAPALAAGNSVVLKPAEQSPLSAIRLAGLAAEAGIPDGVLNVVPGDGPTTGGALGLHGDVDCVAFTGSTETGKAFLAYSAQSNMKAVWLECGGKSPNLVFADAGDLDAVAEMACFGIFSNQGEICSANSRLLVQRDVQEELVGRIARRAREIRPGDPLDPGSAMGAIVDEDQLARVCSYIDEGRRGARLVAGGQRVQVEGRGLFVEPTVFDGVTNDQRIAQDEIFGPVLAVIAFDDEAEAIRIANDSRYGLAASIWTDDLSRAHRVAARLQVGTVSVNTVDALSAATPFGGFKQSGVGRDLSLHALDKYTALKTTWIRYRTA